MTKPDFWVEKFNRLNQMSTVKYFCSTCSWSMCEWTIVAYKFKVRNNPDIRFYEYRCSNCFSFPQIFCYDQKSLQCVDTASTLLIKDLKP